MALPGQMFRSALPVVLGAVSAAPRRTPCRALHPLRKDPALLQGATWVPK